MDRILLIAVLTVAVLVALLWRASRRARKTHTPSSSGADPLPPKPLDTLFDRIDTTPDCPRAFGYKMSWLAIAEADARTVLDSLKMENVQAANWHTGFVASCHGHTFVSPSINGWVFVISHKLPEAGNEAQTQEWTELMTWLSHRHGDVQYFGTHRVVEYHAWSWFRDGDELRTFAWLGERGEILANCGDQTDGEADLGYDYFDPDCAEAEDESYWERDDLCYPDEGHVMEVAGEWSVNPQTLDDPGLPKGSGWIGNLVRASANE